MEMNVELINSGGFSNVYKIVKHDSRIKLTLSSSAAQTLTPDETCVKASCVDKGTCEYELLRAISHENVVKALFGYYDINSGMYLMGMQYYDNELAQETNVNYTQLIRQIVSALCHIHSKGIVHCDIKPSNILISKSKYVIIDMNIANVYKQSGLHRRFRTNLNAPIIGTRQFASLFALLRCLPFCRDDMESFFLVCLFIKKMRTDPVFTDPKINLAELREMRIKMASEYRCIQYLRSMPFYKPLDYKLIYEMMIDEFACL